MMWPIVSLNRVAAFINGDRGKNYPSKGDFIENGIPFINAGNIASDHSVDIGGLSYISEDHFHTLNGGKIKKGDIIFCLRGSLGKFAIIHNNMNGAIASSLVIIRPNKLVDLNYLKHYLSSFLCQREIKAYENGAAQPNLSAKDLKSFKIPLPPFEEQKRIAAILDKADAIRQKRQEAIALSDDFLRSVFLDMFGDPVTNPKGCKLLPMTEVFHIKTGKLNSNAEVKSGVYPFFTCAKEVYRIDHYAFDQEALLLAGNNAQADYDVKHYIGKFNAYQRTYVLSLKNENWSYPFFKFALEFQLSNLKNSSKGSNTKYITMEIMSRTMLPSPSPSEQSEFATYFKQQMDMRNILDKSQQESNALFNSLSQKAFSGQL